MGCKICRKKVPETDTLVSQDQSAFDSDQPVESDQSALDSDQSALDSDQPAFDSDQPKLDSDQPELESDQPALDSDQSALEDALMKYCKKILETESCLSVMVLGEPGIGKSTLINGLLGEEVAVVSPPGYLATKGITTEVKLHELNKNNATIKIWDSPGLLDPTCNTDEILSKVVDIFHEIDLFLFCIDMTSTRYLPNNIVKKLIKKINSVVYGDIWKKTLFTLVRANLAISAIKCQCKSKETIRVAFSHHVSDYHTELTKDLKEFLGDDLHLIPVGHYDEPKLLEDDTKYWLSAFWEKCFERISSTHGKSALVKANVQRLQLSTEEDHTHDEKDMKTKQSHSQNIILSPEFVNNAATAIGVSAVGASVGAIGTGAVCAVAAGAAGAAATTGTGTAAVIAGATAAALLIPNPVFWGILAAGAIGGAITALVVTSTSSKEKK